MRASGADGEATGAVGLEFVPGDDRQPWLHTDWILGQFGSRRSRAVGTYVDFVRAGVGPPNIWDNLRNPIFLGGDAFIERVHKRAPKNVDPGEIPRVQQRSVPKPQSEYQTAAKGDRDGAVAAAFRSGDYTMKQMPEHFGVHYSTVGRAVKKGEQ